MNILFLTLLDFTSLSEHNIYSDLLREFSKHGHKLYIVSPMERRKKRNTYIIKNENVTILKQRIMNIQKTNILEKGISTIIIQSIFLNGIKKYFSEITFDLVLYSTPPITFCKVVEYIKIRDNAVTYLLLKDIFPQNAVDIGMLSKRGLKGIVYKIFRNKEKELYAISDKIGCMSEANVKYILKHNLEVSKEKVEICPNSIEIIDKSIDEKKRIQIRKKYELPLDKIIFVYGGNLGKPQGIDHVVECLKTQKNNDKVFFLIIGDGTEYKKIEKFIQKECQANVRLIKRLSKEEYDIIVAACDVGMIFLDYRFTIPNFPSRLLSYMQAKLPVLAVTDKNTDIGEIIVNNGFGWWCESKNTDDFSNVIFDILSTNIFLKGVNAYKCLIEEYSTQLSYKIIVNHCGERFQ